MSRCSRCYHCESGRLPGEYTCRNQASLFYRSLVHHSFECRQFRIRESMKNTKAASNINLMLFT
jgi:hypothetical protein